MLVIVLGTAQDAGVPQMGCGCTNCKNAIQNNGLKATVASIGIIDPDANKTYIIDATLNIVEQLALLNRCKRKYLDHMKRSGSQADEYQLGLNGIFLTHAHIGHYLGLTQLGKEAAAASNLPVYATGKMVEFLKTNQPYKILIENNNIILHEISAEKKIHVDNGLEITPLAVAHRNELSDTVGYEIVGKRKKLLYIPDMDALDKTTITYISKVDIAIIDGTFYNEAELGSRRTFNEIKHPTIDNSMKVLKPFLENTEIYFTHFNHTNPVLDPNPKAKITRLVKDSGFGLVYAGLVFEL